LQERDANRGERSLNHGESSVKQGESSVKQGESSVKQGESKAIHEKRQGEGQSGETLFSGAIQTAPPVDGASPGSPDSRNIDVVEECAACHSAQQSNKGERGSTGEALGIRDQEENDSGGESPLPEIVRSWVYVYEQ